MKRILIATAGIALFAVPAQAQLIGGGGGGILGGSGGGSIGLPALPPAPSVRDLPATRGTVDGAAQGSGSAKADRRTGRVDANGQGSGNANGSLTGPLVNSSSSGSAAGNGSASAQLIGTDALRGAAQGARSTAQGTAEQARSAAGGFAGSARSAASAAAGSAAAHAGSAAATGQGAANGMFSGAAGQLALAGSGAAEGAGMFSVDKGMPVLAPDGERIGKVRQVIADSRGRVQQLLVKVDGEKALLPAANFSGSGNAVISAMGEGSIKQIADEQDETGANNP